MTMEDDRLLRSNDEGRERRRAKQGEWCVAVMCPEGSDSDGGLDSAPRVLREYGVNVGSKRSVTGSERWRTGDDPMRRTACSETKATIAHAHTYDSR